MKKLVKNNLDGNLKLIEIPTPLAGKGHIVVQTLYSLISTGTELSNIDIGKKNLIQKALDRPEELQKVFNLYKREGLISTYSKAFSNLEKPNSIGYSCSGKVISVGQGVKGFSIGDLVSCGGAGHSEIISIPEKLCTKISDNVSPEEASFVTVASIALEGVRKSKISLGENVAVIGLGLVGQITLDLLKISGVNPIGIDISKSRVNFAKKRGFKCFLRSSSRLENLLLDETSSIGFDSVIITASTNSSDPIDFALKIARERASIVISGNVKIDIKRKLFYSKDLNIKVAKSYGPGRYDKNYEIDGHDYPVGFVRWTENRNMSSINKLLEKKILSFSHLISHIFSIDEFEEAYKQAKDSSSFGILFEYPKIPELDDLKVTNYSSIEKNKSSNMNIGVIGTGSFSQNMFLPLLSKQNGLNLDGICSTQGMMPTHISEKYGFNYSTTDSDEIITNSNTDIIFIMTRNDSHAELVVKCLRNNKDVFVEKPLCLSRSELNEIIEVWSESKGRLMVGFNRRFSPHIVKLKSKISNRTGPVNLLYRVNSRRVPLDNWASNSKVSGGRIISEVCHFLDTCNFLISSKVKSIKCFSVQNLDNSHKDIDTLSILLKYSDGSVANISYSSEGNEVFPKEIIEIHSQGEILEVRDFFELNVYNDKGVKNFKSRNQDKGALAQLTHFLGHISKGLTSPIPFEELVDTSNLTFEILDILKKNK